MEADDLKKDWQSLTAQQAGEQPLDDQYIHRATQRRVRTALRKITIPEMVGSAVCLAGCIYICIHFSALDSIFFQATGVLAVVLLILLPWLSYMSMSDFMSSNSTAEPYVAAVRRFAKNKIRFRSYQHINGILSYLLQVTVIILLPKFFYGKNVASYQSFWMFAFSFGFIFLLLYARWVKRFYGKMLREAEELLQVTQPD